MSGNRPQSPPPRSSDLPTLVANIDLHPQAQTRIEQYVDEFTSSILLQSKTLALTQRANIVLSTHVDDARQIVNSRAQASRLRETLLIAGSAMVGTFLQGFPTELAAEPMRKNMIIFNVCMGVLGILLVTWGLARKS